MAHGAPGPMLLVWQRVPFGAEMPKGDAPRSASAPNPPSLRNVPRPPFPSLSAESTVSAQDGGASAEPEAKSNCGQSAPATLDSGGQFLDMGAECVTVLNARAAAYLVRFRSAVHRNEILERTEIPRVTPFPACARFKFGDGRLWQVPRDAEVSAGIAGSREKFTASAAEADISALLRKGALVGFGGQPDCSRDISSCRKQGVASPLKVHQVGHYVLRAVAF